MNTTTTPNNACILFLDFDGVTHPEPCFQENVFCRVALIEAVLREFQAVQIVISSSWRDHYPLEKIRTFFAPDIGARLIGVTPSIKNPGSDWLPGHVPEFEREWAIESWMKSNCPWGTPWLAIDDRPRWFRPDCSNLLITKQSIGFCPDDQDRLRAMLRERL